MCMTCGDGGKLTLCDECDGLFHSEGCHRPLSASTNRICYCSTCQTTVFTALQTRFTENGERERKLQGECLATNKVVYIQRPSPDHAVPVREALDKLLALNNYLHVESYDDALGRKRFLIVGKLHDVRESQAWHAVSLICTVMNLPMYLEPLPENVRHRVEAYKNHYNCTWFGALKRAQSSSGQFNTFRFIPQFKHDTCDNVYLDDHYVKCICNEPISNIFFRRISCFDFTTGGICNSYTVRNAKRPRGDDPDAWANELFNILMNVIEKYGIALEHDHGLHRRVKKFIRA